jgi:hypothetical protein
MYNLFIVVKIIGIIFAILWFAIFGTINAKIIDYLFLQNIDDEKHVTNLQTFSWVIILTICVSILCFFGRNIIERIPFVLENVQAFEFKRLKEIKSGSILLFFSILFSSAYHKIIKRIKELKL